MTLIVLKPLLPQTTCEQVLQMLGHLYSLILGQTLELAGLSLTLHNSTSRNQGRFSRLQGRLKELNSELVVRILDQDFLIPPARMGFNQ